VQPCLRELLEHPEAILDRSAAFPVRMGWRWGAPEGLFLAGDAAGFVDPFSGQGISLALLGGEACSSAASLWLQGRTAAARLSYARFLRRELAPRLVVGAALRRVMAHSSWTSGVLRTMRRHPELGRQLVGLTRNAGSAWLTSLPRFAGRLATP
jgi:flavin-dependent dehydrogenase